MAFSGCRGLLGHPLKGGASLDGVGLSAFAHASPLLHVYLCRAGLLADYASQSQYCQQQGSGSGGSRLALCVDTHTGDGCNSSSSSAVGADGGSASKRRQYVGEQTARTAHQLLGQQLV